ncbi:hypothetical protein LXL04_039049 [Taraxacum kok-saghyz]
MNHRNGTRAMRRRQFYSANGFVSGNRAIRNFFSKKRYPHMKFINMLYKQRMSKTLACMICGYLALTIPFEPGGRSSPVSSCTTFISNCTCKTARPKLNVMSRKRLKMTILPFIPQNSPKSVKTVQNHDQVQETLKITYLQFQFSKLKKKSVNRDSFDSKEAS